MLLHNNLLSCGITQGAMFKKHYANFAHLIVELKFIAIKLLQKAT